MAGGFDMTWCDSLSWLRRLHSIVKDLDHTEIIWVIYLFTLIIVIIMVVSF